MWISLGDTNFNLPFEAPSAHPAPNRILLYPWDIFETEFLIRYGGVAFASIMGRTGPGRVI